MRCEATPALPTADMHWNYFNIPDPENYLQPKLVMAAGVNPDQSWVLGVVNTTGIKVQHQPPSSLATDMTLVETMDVTVDIPALEDTARVYFSVFKSYLDRIEKIDQVVMENGKLHLLVGATEHLMLQSDSMSNVSIDPGTGVELFSDAGLEFEVYPNPFNGQAHFRFKLPSACEVAMEIVDITGRKVFTSPKHHYYSGMHQLSWDGNDMGGRSVSAGVFIARLIISSNNQTIVKNLRILKSE